MRHWRLRDCQNFGSANLCENSDPVFLYLLWGNNSHLLLVSRHVMQVANVESAKLSEKHLARAKILSHWLWRLLAAAMVWGPPAIRENREFKKWKFSFFHQRHALSISFDIFVVTYRVTFFFAKTCWHAIIFYGKKLNFHFWFSPIFWLCQEPQVSVFSPLEFTMPMNNFCTR